MDRLATVAILVLGAGLAGGIRHTNIPVNAHSELRRIESCPDEGYFFQREVSPNAVDPGPCYLCFCRDHHTAVCWMRADDRCDVKLRKRVHRNTRVRRSPISLSDIFFRDSTRDFFDKKLPQQCKPHEGSFSEGCPPDDWCIGCTVCDCDANGRWDCHVLSFCDGKHNSTKQRVPTPNRKNFRDSKKVFKKNKSLIKTKNGKPKKLNIISKNKNISRKDNKLRNSKKYQQKRKQNINSMKNTKKPQAKISTTKKTPRKFIKKPQKNTKTSKKKPYKRKVIINTKNKKKKTPELEQAVLDKVLLKRSVNESELGRTIIRTVMSSVQNMIAKQVAMIQNSTTVQRRVNGQTDCSQNMKVNKKNRKQKVNNNKKKIKKRQESKLPQRLLDKYKQLLKSRTKREVSHLPIEDSVKPDDTLSKDKNSTMNSTADKTDTRRIAKSDVPWIVRSTATDTMYYKYTIDSNLSNATCASDSSLNRKTNKTHNYVLNLIDPDKNSTEIKAKQLRSPKYFNIQRNVTDQVRKSRKSDVLKTYDIFVKSLIHGRTVNNNADSITSTKRSTHKLHGQDIKRKLERISKRNLKRMIFPNFRDGSTNYFGNLFQTNNTIRNVSYSNSLFNNLVMKLHQNLTNQEKPKTQYNIFKYLKTIIRMLFNHNKQSKMKKHKTNEGYTLEVLCNNNEACYTNEYNILTLRAKLHGLNTEAETIFKAIKVIKVSLQHLNMHIYKQNKSNNSHNNDMLKLKAILRGTHKEVNNITVLQAAQVNYVKRNIETFILSIGKFSFLLHEILDELHKNNEKYSCQRNSRLLAKKQKLRSINKIKNLLVKYSIVQNTFMKKMYELLTNAEKKTFTEYSHDNNSDNKQVLDKYANILDNLEKLKNLAQAFKSRRKRHTVEEDNTMEYLLSLMDHLLRQNRPLNTDPANDGIDLLIEAIQNAPDIKPIKKKVLDYISTTQIPTRISLEDFGHLGYDNSDSNKLFIEENQIKNEILTTQKSEFEENINQKFININNYDITTKYATRTEYIPFIAISSNDNDKIGEATGEKPEKIQERTGFDKLESIINDKNTYEVYNGDSDDENVIPIAANITEFSNDLEDETSTNVLITTPEVIVNEFFTKESKTTSKSVVNEEIAHISRSTTNEAIDATRTTYDFKLAETITDMPIASIPMRDYKFDDDDSTVTNNKTKLDWIEENFETEIREFSVGVTTVAPKLTQTNIVKPAKFNNKQNIRFAVRDEETKKRKSKDEVMQLKDDQFLNSLDYGQGTEKPEFEDTEDQDDDDTSYM